MTEDEQNSPHDEDTLNTEHIFASELDFAAEKEKTYGSGVMDSAATKTVSGLDWFENFKAYLISIGKKFTMQASNVWYKFGDDGRRRAMFQATFPVRIFGQTINLLLILFRAIAPCCWEDLH